MSPENPKNLGSDLRTTTSSITTISPHRLTHSSISAVQFSGQPMAHPPYDPYYLQQQPQPVPPPQPQDYSDRSAINTLFVSGLPDDVKAREIHNLFRRRPGFDSCQLKYTGRGNQVKLFPFVYISEYFSFCFLFFQGKLNENFVYLFQVVAFATFFNHQSAMAALHSLNVSKNNNFKFFFSIYLCVHLLFYMSNWTSN